MEPLGAERREFGWGVGDAEGDVLDAGLGQAPEAPDELGGAADSPPNCWALRQ